jgi:hypothetical protein
MSEVERLTTGGLSEVLTQAAPAIARGAVNVLSVAAIRDHSPERWPRKREQVHAFLERAFARASSPDAFIAPLNEIEFVAVQPSRSRSAALGFSANILRETLQFFLGAAARANMRLYQVTDFVAGSLCVEPVDLASWENEEVAPDLGLGAVSGGEAERYQAAAVAALSTAVLRKGARCWRIIMPDGAPATVATGVAPVWNVRACAITSFLVESQAMGADADGSSIITPTATLSCTAAGEVALRALMAAEERIGVEAARPRVGMLVPLSLGALAYSGPRYRILHALRDLPEPVRRYLLLEIVDLPEGFPQGRMAELVAMLAPHVRGVIARAPSLEADVTRWRDSGLSGVSLDGADLDPAECGIPARLTRFAKSVRHIGPGCMAHGLEARCLLLAAWAAGFSHLAGPAVSLRALGFEAIRFAQADLYRAGPVTGPPRSRSG